jgi:GNAT superfamily N-acetyltransferase
MLQAFRLNMDNLTLKLVETTDEALIDQIAVWYHQEWSIPVQKTKNNLKLICSDHAQMQAVLFAAGIPVATGGIYHHVGLLDLEPRFKVHPHWLALVYTIPQYRQRGYAARLCNYLRNVCLRRNIENLHLFTDSAEAMYLKLGWQVVERLNVKERNLAIMQIRLS